MNNNNNPFGDMMDVLGTQNNTIFWLSMLLQCGFYYFIEKNFQNMCMLCEIYSW